MNEYGVPVYFTINASDPEAVKGAIKAAIKEANEYNSTLYLVLNSGKPAGPPPPPPGEGE